LTSISNTTAELGAKSNHQS